MTVQRLCGANCGIIGVSHPVEEQHLNTEFSLTRLSVNNTLCPGPHLFQLNYSLCVCVRMKIKHPFLKLKCQRRVDS